MSKTVLKIHFNSHQVSGAAACTPQRQSSGEQHSLRLKRHLFLTDLFLFYQLSPRPKQQPELPGNNCQHPHSESALV